MRAGVATSLKFTDIGAADQDVLSIAFLPMGIIVTGAPSGAMVLWHGGASLGTITLGSHAAELRALVLSADQLELFTG